MTKLNGGGRSPVDDGYIRIATDAAGQAQVWSNLDPVASGLGWRRLVTVDDVAPSGLHLQGAFITA